MMSHDFEPHCLSYKTNNEDYCSIMGHKKSIDKRYRRDTWAVEQLVESELSHVLLATTVEILARAIVYGT